MALFQKKYFALNNSLSKNILVCLRKKDGKFSAQLNIFGEKDGITLTLGQYKGLVSEKNNVLSYMDGGVSALDFDLSGKDTELFATGRKAQCAMLLMRQVDKLSGKVNVVCLAKNTFERLMELEPLITHEMTKLDNSATECEMIKGGGVNEHGLDLCALEMEMNLFEMGVKDCIFK
jgi:hypothetical protein